MADVRLLAGDCFELLKTLDDGSIDAVVTDPPYGISFMGKHWDRFDIDRRVGVRDVSKLGVRLTGDADSPNRKETTRTASAFANAAGEAGDYDTSLTGNRRFQEWCAELGAELLRVLKPGGHALVFGGTRTHHRMTAGLEDAGFEIRDELQWLFGSGFPKSLDVAGAIDSPFHGPECADGFITSAARDHAGKGTALKPGHEPIVVARKPLAGTVAANVLEHGVGGLNIDACRIAFRDAADEAESKDKNRHADFGTEPGGNQVYGDYSMVESKNYDAPGRWPANVVLDEEAAALLDEQTGELVTGAKSAGVYEQSGRRGGIMGEVVPRVQRHDYSGDRGGASRFFYCAKVSRAERNAGLDTFDELPSLKIDPTSAMARDGRRGSGVARNHHPTVKPIDLMRWLIRLVTPPGGVVLDPFLGSGSTGCAAVLEGVGFVGCEREPDYMAIAEARIDFWREHGDDGLRIVRERDAATAKRQAIEDAGQLGLFGEAAA